MRLFSKCRQDEKKLVFNTNYKGQFYSVYRIGVIFSFQWNDFYNLQLGNMDYPLLVHSNLKTTHVSLSHFEYLCYILKETGFFELCEDIKNSDTGEAHILGSEFDVSFQDNDTFIELSANVFNYPALRNTETTRRIKSVLYDVGCYFRTLYEMDKEQKKNMESVISQYLRHSQSR